MAANNWTREETLVLINLYRECECLYNVRHPDYLKKRKRHEKLVYIQNELKEIKTNVNVSMIKNKIKCLLSQVSKERQRMRSSRRSGAGSAEIYTPSLWCYKDVEFLLNTRDEEKGTSTLNLNQDDETDLEEGEEPDLEAGASRSPKRQRSMENSIQLSAQKSLDMFSSLMDNFHKKQKTKEDLFCEYLCQELKRLQLEDTFDELKIKFIRLIDEAKKEEKGKISTRNSFGNWRNISSSSSSPLNINSRTSSCSSSISSITSTPDNYGSFEDDLNTNPIIIEDIKFLHPRDPCSSLAICPPHQNKIVGHRIQTETEDLACLQESSDTLKNEEGIDILALATQDIFN